MRTAARGIAAERLVRELLESGAGPGPVKRAAGGRTVGWFVARAAGSLGDVDLVALQNGRALLIEVKTTKRGPFHSFGPRERNDLRAAASVAGCEAWLVWIPPTPGIKGTHGCWIPEGDWPA